MNGFWRGFQRGVAMFFPYAIAAVSIIAILYGAKGLYDHQQQRVGILREKLRVADSSIVALERRARVIDTVYRRDTIELTRQVTKWREIVRLRVDTLADTVLVPVEVVREVVRQADSTINACLATVMTCEQRVALRDSIGARKDEKIRLLEAQRPGLFRKIGGAVIPFAIGVLVGRGQQ